MILIDMKFIIDSITLNIFLLNKSSILIRQVIETYKFKIKKVYFFDIQFI